MIQQTEQKTAILPLQETSHEIWESKYQLKHGKTKVAIDASVPSTYKRVSHALAEVEFETGVKSGEYAAHERDATVERIATEYYNVMHDGGCWPAGRIMSNAGAGAHKPKTSTINCFSGETTVLTKEYGTVRMDSIVDKPVHVLNANGDWSPTHIRSHGVQEVFPVSFAYSESKSPITVRATRNHRWIMENGRVITTEFWMTGGDPTTAPKGYATIPAVRARHSVQDFESYGEGFLHGAVYGDGSRSAHNENSYYLPLFGEKRELAEFIENVTGIVGKETDHGKAGFSLRFNNIKRDVDLKAVPSQYNDDYLRGFFAGILATDGSVHSGSRGSTYVCVYGDEKLAEFLHRTLPTIGIIPTKVSKDFEAGEATNLCERRSDVYRVTIHSATIREEDIFRAKHLENFCVSDTLSASSKVWRFRGVGTEGKLEKVYCCEESETHSFVISSCLLTGNCTVSETIEDSMEGIFGSLYKAAITLKYGCGIGYEFSSIRPKGAPVNGVGAYTNGPLAFADVFDKGCFTVSSAGGRRGAQMLTFDVSHPDVLDVIKAKREDGRLRQFNISILITNAFMEAVKRDEMWHFMWNGKPFEDKKMPARELWGIIMKSTYDFAEPGFLLIDAINYMNNLWFCENIRATNPCGEQP